MTFFVLAMDGLESQCVEEWNLTHLLQTVHGSMEVPIDKTLGCPTTPQVWASFLTGQWNDKLRFDYAGKIRWVMNLVKFLRRHIPIRYGIGSVLVRRYGVAIQLPKLTDPTFIEEAKFTTINVPYFDYNHVPLNLGLHTEQGKMTMKELEVKLWEDYRNTSHDALFIAETCQPDENVMVYLHYPDSLQHLYLERKEMREIYEMLDGLAGTLQECSPQSEFVIVSDHGFDFATELHSNHGYYSFNTNIAKRPEKVTDFYNIFVKNTRLQKQRKKRRLRKVKYIRRYQK